MLKYVKEGKVERLRGEGEDGIGEYASVCVCVCVCVYVCVVQAVNSHLSPKP